MGEQSPQRPDPVEVLRFIGAFRTTSPEDARSRWPDWVAEMATFAERAERSGQSIFVGVGEFYAHLAARALEGEAP